MNDTDIASAYSDQWADIDAIFALPLREPGDIDVTQMVERYGGHVNTARARMQALVDKGEWEFITVVDVGNRTGKRKIIRRVKR